MTIGTFESNILNIYSDKGKAWLDELPKLITDVASRLDVRSLTSVSNLSYSYVLSGFQGDSPVILKLGLDRESLKKEAFALNCFAGFGAVNVIDEEDGVLLLECAVPGISLKNCFPAKDMDAIAIACKVIKKLHQATIPNKHNFPHIKNWLSALDKDWDIPPSYLQKARALRDQLLTTSSPEVVLHGDLHHDNILKNGVDWAVIDPKGVIGEPAYETAAFIRNPIPELLKQEHAVDIIQRRMSGFSQALHIPITRIANWSFVQAGLAWAWALEDKCDTQYWEQLTRILDEL